MLPTEPKQPNNAIPTPESCENEDCNPLPEIEGLTHDEYMMIRYGGNGEGIDFSDSSSDFDSDSSSDFDDDDDDDSSDDSSDDRGATTRMEAKTPRSSGTGDTFHYCR